MDRTIRVISDVKDLSELLDGASVDHARLVPSGARLRLEVELTRACAELQTVARRGWFTKTKTPWVKSRLSFAHIKDASIQRVEETPVQQVPLLSCEAIAGGYTLVMTSPDGLRLTVVLEQLDGQFADFGQPITSP